MQFLIDVTGTLIRPGGREACPGAAPFIAALRAKGVPYLILSNHSTGSPDQLITKLGAVGIHVGEDEVLTAAKVAADYLVRAQRGACLVLGRQTLAAYLRRRGVEVAQPGDPDLPRSGWAVAVGFDESLSWERMKAATEWLLGGARLFALHSYKVYKDGDGWRGPGVGMIARALAYGTGRRPFVFGKPSPNFYKLALRRLPHGSGSTWLVSDDPEGDLAGGQRLGMRTVFVETGKYSAAEAGGGRLGWREDVVLPHVGACASLLARG